MHTHGPTQNAILLPHPQGDVSMHVHDERALLALQGPEAAAVLQPHMKEDLGKFYFSQFLKTDVKGIPCFITRTGWVACVAPVCRGFFVLCGPALLPPVF